MNIRAQVEIEPFSMEPMVLQYLKNGIISAP